MVGFYVAAHWRGEHSLARSYWVNGALLTIAMSLAFLALEPLQQEARLETLLVTVLVLLAVIAVVVVWQLVGIWRSATNSAVRTGRGFWPVVAKIMVVLGAISATGQTWTSGSDVVRTLVALRDPDLTEYYVERRGSTDLILTGAINDASVAEVLRGLADPSITILRVNSHGGMIGPAIKLARHVRANDVMVMAEGECASACVVLLAASPQAAIYPGAKVTFHRFAPVAELSNPEARLESQLYLHEVGEIYREFHVAEWALDIAQQQEFWTPSLEQLIRMNLVIQVFEPDQQRFVRAVEYCASHPVECGK